MNHQSAAKSRKPGRNDPCPCGSGKKYKKCCADHEPGSNADPLTEAFGLLHDGRVSEAEVSTRRIIQSSPGNGEAIYLLGLINYKKGELHGCRELMEQALDVLPGNGDIHCNLSRVFFELGDVEQSEIHARQAIQSYPHSADAYNNLGNALKKQGKLDESIENFKKAIIYQAKDPLLWVNLGSAYHLNGVTGQAIDAYKEAIKIDAVFVPAHNNIAALYALLQDYEQALKHYEKVAAYCQIDPDLACNIGNVYTNLGKPADAKHWYKKALEIEPHYVGAYINLASLCASQGLYDGAKSYYEKALALDKGDVQALIGVATIEEEQHNLEQAGKFACHILEIEKNDTTLYAVKAKLLLSRIYRRQERFDESVSMLFSVKDAAEKRDDTGSAFYFEMGQYLEREDRYDKAFEAFRVANCRLRATRSRGHNREENVRRFSALKRVFSKKDNKFFPPVSDNKERWPRPIFIVGFPRSGTTLMEQMLASHYNVQAGGELHALGELEASLGEILKTTTGYPESILELSNNKPGVLLDLRNYYLDRVRTNNVIKVDTKWFTDKMPLNITALGLISIVFPDSPIIHMQRNPMDVCLSIFFTHFGEGNEYSFDLADTAHFYSDVMDLVDYYQSNLFMRYIEVSYEDLVKDTENVFRGVIKFIGLPWDDRYLEFNKSTRVAHTASYEQVTRPIYKTSVGRYKKYEQFLQEPLEILEPVMKRYGYL